MSPIHLLWACILTHRHLNGASVVCLTLKFILTFLSPSSPQHSFPWLDPYSPSIRQWPQPHFCTHSLQAPLWDFYFPPSSMFPPQGSFTEASGNPSSHFLKEVDLPCPEYPHLRFMLLLLSRFSCVWLCATPQMAAHQALPSLGFSRQEHWSGLPFPSPMHESESEVAQSCLILHHPMDCSLPGASVHGIFQARVLEWVAIAFSVWDLYTILKRKGSVTYFGTWNVMLSSNNKKAKI